MNPSAENRRLAKNTVFLYFRSIFLLVVSLYTSRITLRVLGVEDFGVYQVVGGVVAMFSILSSALTSASQRFITYSLGEDNISKQKNVFSACVTLHIVLGLIVVMLLEILGIWFLNHKLNLPQGRLYAASWVFQISVATFFVGVISVPFNAVVVAHEKMSAFAYISILEGILKLGAVFCLMYITFDKLVFYSIMIFVISLLNRTIYFLYSHRHFMETHNFSFNVDRRMFKEMFAFAGWNLFGNGAFVLRNQGVDIVLNLFFGVTVNAAKGVSNQVQNAVQHLGENFLTAMRPQLTKAVAQKNYSRTFSLLNNGSRYAFIMMLFLAVPIIVSAPKLLAFLLDVVPEYSVSFVRWTMFYLLLDSVSRMLIHAILSEGNIRTYQIVVGGTKLLAIPFVYTMLKMGMVTPLVGVWTNIILEVCCLFERLYFNYKLLHVDYMKFMNMVLIRCGFLLFVSLGLSYLFSNFVTNDFVPVVVASILFSSILSIWLIGLNGRERYMIVEYIRNCMRL